MRLSDPARDQPACLPDGGDLGDSGALIAEGGLAALECSADRLITAGDHLLVLARVTGVPYVAGSGEPLVRFRRRYLLARL